MPKLKWAMTQVNGERVLVARTTTGRIQLWVRGGRAWRDGIGNKNITYSVELNTLTVDGEWRMVMWDVFMKDGVFVTYADTQSLSQRGEIARDEAFSRLLEYAELVYEPEAEDGPATPAGRTDDFDGG